MLFSGIRSIVSLMLVTHMIGMRRVFLLLIVFSLSSSTAFAQSTSKSLDPMNRPMDELGVSGKDDTLCSDRWYSCTTYDRQQFERHAPLRRAELA
jgi:hypothetical protein